MIGVLFILGAEIVQDVENLQQAYLSECSSEKDALPEYDPEKFKLFSNTHGAPHLFNFVSACMNSTQHTSVRKKVK